MASGIIDLSSLYELVSRIDDPKKILRVKTPEGQEYRDIVSNKMLNVSENSGFYLWGQFDEKKFWTNIYLGKAALGKISSLKYRIKDELGEERVFVIQDTMTEDLRKEFKEIYPDKWDIYIKLFERALLKHRAKYIVWTEFNSNDNNLIREIESDLIESINPKSNVQRKTPPTNVKEEAINILREFRYKIHEQRDKLKSKK